MNKSLHIVCLDMPWPPDYGGAIDMMNRIISLHQLGVQIHLHYFSYNERGKPEILSQYCQTIHTYSRKGLLSFLFSSQPYIVASRTNKKLIQNLSKDKFPILLEGLHCTGILKYLPTDKRKIVVRMHNDEGLYYHSLATNTINILQKKYYQTESKRIKRFYSALPKNCFYACITEKETSFFKNELGFENSFYLPVFPNEQAVTCNPGKGEYCLYHGNLSIAENEKAAAWIVQHIFSKTPIPFIVAGKNPSLRLQKLISRYPNISVALNPTATKMAALIQAAQINILPSLATENTGIKLKLLHALFTGRHCLVNHSMVEGTGVETLCSIAEGEKEMSEKVQVLFRQEFSVEEIKKREKILKEIFNNRHNAEKLSAYLW